MRFYIGMHRQSNVRNLDWSHVAAFAIYLLRWVQGGFSGQGGLLFTHPDGIIMQASMTNGYTFIGEATDILRPGVCAQPSTTNAP